MNMINNTLKILLSGLVILSAACTDLEVEEQDSLVIETETGEFGGVNPSSSLTSAYTDLRAFNTQENLFALTEVTSDELLVPTRGTDWGDNGVWRTLHQHTWDATHRDVLGTWNTLNSNVFRLNQLLAPASNADATQTAEGKFLRAYNMFWILDLYGQIPFREADQGANVNPSVLSAEEAYNFIEQDLMEAIPDLPEFGPEGNNIRASKAAGHFLLAKLLLNKHVYLGSEPEASTMDRVIENVNAIAADGYSLDQGYFEIFEPSEDSETILYTDAGVDTRIWNGLHYAQGTPANTGGGWNGFSTTADFYALFEGDDDSNTPDSEQEERRGFVPTDGSFYGVGFGFLVGQQYDDEGNPLTDRVGNPLVFTKDFPGLAGNNERTGIRIIKYHPRDEIQNHLVLLRYSDAYLMKIEAILRGGSSEDDPLGLLNNLREVRSASPLAEVDLNVVLDERGRELYTEGWRRNDQIRFGTFTSPWVFKSDSEDYRKLFPIPSNALATNPNLVQNPGY